MPETTDLIARTVNQTLLDSTVQQLGQAIFVVCHGVPEEGAEVEGVYTSLGKAMFEVKARYPNHTPWRNAYPDVYECDESEAMPWSLYVRQFRLNAPLPR